MDAREGGARAQVGRRRELAEIRKANLLFAQGLLVVSLDHTVFIFRLHRSFPLRG